MKRALAPAALALALAVAIAGARASAESGDPAIGERLYGECGQCHEIGAGARNRIGPHLNGLFGRKAGGLEGFRYSPAMRRQGANGLEWHAESLSAYVENPRALVTGTRMSYRGMKDPSDRAHLLAYLREFSDDPANIPEADPTASDEGHDLDPEILALEGDPDYGEYLSGECTTCHQASGSDQGIPSITNWPEEDFVIAMHAYKSERRPHPVMRMVAGRLSNEEIAALAAYFHRLGPE